MDALKAQWERILQQLNALTATQKMLVAALVAVMVMTVLYWGRYASNAEMVSILGDQVLTADDIGPIENQLELGGIPHSLVNNKIMVPAERKGEILASLMFARVLPQDTHSAFETMSRQLNPFSSNAERDATYTEATAMELSSIIGQFPGVSSAKVIINSKAVERVEDSIHPSATVFLTTRGTPEHERALVRAAADGVAHAVSGLSPTEISVIVNGVSRKAPAADVDSGGGSDDLMDIKQRTESHLEQKIREQFPSITGLTVSVTCDVENRTIETKGLDYDKAKSFVLQKKTITNTDETSTSAANSHEPGVSANAGANGSASVDGGSGAAAAPNTSNTEHNESENSVLASTLETDTKTPAGKDSVQAATVGVPTSYFEAVYKKKHPSEKNPDDAALAALTKAEVDTIHQRIKTMLVLKSDDALSVAPYTDFSVDLAMATGPSAPAATLSTVSGHAREIGVAVLAVISLMMMAMMVRKSSPAPVMLGNLGVAAGGGEASATASRAAMSALLGGEMVAGEVGAGNAALDGMEMDEDAVRTQQMLDQVSTMVKENPDGAAALVKRWLSRT